MRLITETAGADGERVNAISREILRPVALVLLRSDTSYSLHRVKTTGDEEVYHLKNQKVAGGIFAYDGRFGRYRYIYDIKRCFSPTADKKDVIVVTECFGSVGCQHPSVMEAIAQEIINLAAENKLGILILNDIPLRCEIEARTALLRHGSL